MELKQKKFPGNVIITVTHGGCYIPEIVYNKLSKKFKEKSHRIIKNFSDFACSKLIPKNIPENQKIIAHFSRAIGDPGRVKDSPDLFRETDFNGIPIWDKPLTKAEKAYLVKNYYRKYHNKVLKSIQEAEKKYKTVIVFDIHDTGNRMLKPNPDDDRLRSHKFPKIDLGCLRGTSCKPEIIKVFAKALEKHLGMHPTIDKPFKGDGAVTTKYGKFFNDTLPKEKRFARNVIQVELGRYLYMDEKTQKTNHEHLKIIQKGLDKAIEEVGNIYL